MSIKSQRRKRITLGQRRSGLRKAHNLRLESLERRECPAVLFEFSPDTGLLKVTGDDGPNNVEIVATDRTVQVVGDGLRSTFRGVLEVFVDTGRGDDRIQTTRQTTIVVDLLQSTLGFKTRIQAGSGDDVVRISDFSRTSGSSAPGLFTSPLSAEIDLGVGSDEAVVQLNHHDAVDLAVASDDGVDAILIGVLIPAVQRIRAAAMEVELDLAGGGNLVDVSVENFDDVSISARSADPSSTSVNQNDTWQVKHKYAAANPILSAVNLDLDFDLGSAHEAVHIVQSNRSRDARHYVRVSAELNGGDDTLQITTEQTAALDFDIDVGAGDDTVTINDRNRRLGDGSVISRDWNGHIDLGSGADRVTVAANNHMDADLQIVSADGGDVVAAGILLTICIGPNGETFVCGARAALELGGGNNFITMTMENYDNTDLDIKAAGGGNRVRANLSVKIKEASRLSFARANVDLGDGDNQLQLSAKQFHQVNANLRSGGGNDSMWIDVSGQPLVAGVRSQLNVVANLGAGSDQFHLRSQGFHDFQTTIDAGPRGDGRDIITTQHVIQSPRGPASRIRRALDHGLDQATFFALGYTSHNVSTNGDTGTHEVGHWVEMGLVR